ncbi:hypothetical protein BRD17_06360 [Halobacteriales archaeon SW_7_68_16]|nr:MAG: hypothetical protein BRD17_06360 [Halobacteriales archaeon SW_7_68_16]
MGWFGRHRIGVLATLLLVDVAAIVAVTLLGGLAVIAALPTGVVGLASAALPWVAALAVLSVAGVGIGGWLAYVLVRRASLPRSDRLATIVRRVERLTGLGVGLAGYVEPNEADRVESLRERYVTGDLSEDEYERRLERVLDDEGRDVEEVRRDVDEARRERRRREREYR